MQKEMEMHERVLCAIDTRISVCALVSADQFFFFFFFFFLSPRSQIFRPSMIFCIPLNQNKKKGKKERQEPCALTT